jgi:hypothetical protein
LYRRRDEQALPMVFRLGKMKKIRKKNLYKSPLNYNKKSRIVLPVQVQLLLNKKFSQLCIGISIFYLYRRRDKQALPMVFRWGKVKKLETNLYKKTLNYNKNGRMVLPVQVQLLLNKKFPQICIGI